MYDAKDFVEPLSLFLKSLTWLLLALFDFKTFEQLFSIQGGKQSAAGHHVRAFFVIKHVRCLLGFTSIVPPVILQ